MKLIKKLLALAAALCLVCAIASPAFAEGTDDERFAGKTWDEVVEKYISDYGIEPTMVALGYRNLVTGEEHYYNGDKFMINASLYKVPLNMYYNDLVANGEMDWDTIVGYGESTYEYLMMETIVNSNNEMAGTLMSRMGGYQAMRKLICPYMGVDEATADPLFLTQDYFTPRQMISCLTQLYEGGERYSKIIEYMKQAEPANYFKFNTQEFEVAHKYGFDRDNTGEHLDDCAIVYTDEPIAIVMLSNNLAGGYNTMSDYCILMSDYTQYTIAQRAVQEAQVKVEAKAAERAATVAATPAPIVIESASHTLGIGGIIAVGFTLLFAVAALVFIIKAGVAGKLKAFWGILAVLLATLALLLCIVGCTLGTIVAKPEGNPQETVSTFFDALLEKNYNAAYDCLLNCESLGLENSPSTAAGQLVYDALKNSYSYELFGDCVTDKLLAYQQLRFDYLDLTAFEADVKEATPDALKKLVQSKPRNQIYDSNNEYLPEITQEAYELAVANTLKNVEAYYTTTWLTAELNYSDGQWLIVTDTELLKAVTGGVGY